MSIGSGISIHFADNLIVVLCIINYMSSYQNSVSQFCAYVLFCGILIVALSGHHFLNEF